MRQIISGLAFLALGVIGCQSGVEQSLPPSDSSEIVADQTVPLGEFPHGTWFLNATLDQGQAIAGFVNYTIRVENDRPTCVANSYEWHTNIQLRPVTFDDDGSLEMRFRVSFVRSPLEEIFAAESIVEVTIVGERTGQVIRDDGLVHIADYDVVVLEHFVFSQIQLASTGTLTFILGVAELTPVCDNPFVGSREHTAIVGH